MSKKFEDAILKNKFLASDGTLRPLSRILTPILQKLAGRFQRFADCPGGSTSSPSSAHYANVFKALQSELERRGEDIYTRDWRSAQERGGVCFCGKRGMWVVGKVTFCDAHKAVAVRRRRRFTEVFLEPAAAERLASIKAACARAKQRERLRLSKKRHA